MKLISACLRNMAFAVFALFVWTHPVRAQPGPTPRVAMDLKGPVGRTLSLVFSHDSNRIYEGGFSKVVNVWDVGFNGPDAPPVAAPLESLRWEISRSVRGRINCLTMSPTADLLAVAGSSARGDGDITLFDLGTNQVESTIPAGFPGVRFGHLSSIVDLDFSPDGQQLASMDQSGRIIAWTRQADGGWTGVEVRRSFPTQIVRHRLIFLDNRRILTHQQRQAGDDTLWNLAIHPVTGQPPQVLQAPLLGQEVVGFAKAPDADQFVVAASNGYVGVFPGNGPFEPVPVYHGESAGRDVTAIALGPNRLLAVGVSRFVTEDFTESEIRLIDLKSGQILGFAKVGVGELINAIAFSNDGHWLAVNDDSQRVDLFDLRNGGQLGEPALALSGRGKEITNVVVRRGNPGDPLSLGFSHSRDLQIRKIFTPASAEVERLEVPLPDHASIGQTTYAEGWRLRVVPGSEEQALRQSIDVITPEGLVFGNISIDVKTQGKFVKEGAFCFLPGSGGRPSAVALGTDTQSSIFLYSLDGQLLRYFRDHTGEVTALSVTPDGRYLVSSSRDQTMKIWSLEGLANPARSPGSSRWGCDFVVEGNSLRVRGVLKAGLAFRRNFRDGDTMTVVRVSRNDQLIDVVDPVEMRRELMNAPAVDQLRIEASRNGELLPKVTIVVGWEPLLTLFVDTRDEWIAYTPEGYYNASDAEGQRLFGWQLNLGRGVTPRFEPAENFQKDYERPDVIRSVLERGNLFDALAATHVEPPPNADFAGAIVSTIEEIPRVVVESPKQTEKFSLEQKQIPLRARIEGDLGKGNFEVQAFSNGVRLPDTQFDPQSQTVTASAPNESNLNSLEVVIRERDKPITESVQQRALRSVRGDEAGREKPPVRQFHYLAMACENYQNYGKLKFTHDDAQVVLDRFVGETFETLRVYPEIGMTKILYDDEVNFANFEEAVSQVEARLKRRGESARDDLLVVLISGHGITINDEFYFLPTTLSDRSPNAIAGQNGSPGQGLRWFELCSIVHKLDCQVVWLLDACHSGSAPESETVKKMLREANQPTQRFVMASSATSQQSLEDSKFAINGDAGHGLFTYWIIQSLSGQEDGLDTTDGIVNVDDLAFFMRPRVYKDSGRSQTPVFVPTTSNPHDTKSRQIDLTRVPSP